MPTFFLTFPATATAPYAHGWVQVSAKDELEAADKAVREFGHDWSRIWNEKQFDADKRSWYPSGCVGKI